MADLTLELPDYRQNDLPRTVRRLYDHAGALTEQLRYVLMHLDEENIPALGGLQEELADAEGNLSVLRQTAAALLARVENAEGGLSSLILTADALATRVEGAEGGISTLTQTANALTTRVESAEGGLTTVQQTANGLSSTVTDLSGKYTSLQQTVDGFNFTGVVYFSDLTDGATSISGDCIDTGSISLKYLDISNGYGYMDIQRGSTGSAGSSTRGVVLGGPTVCTLNGEDISNYVFVTDAGVRLTAWDEDYEENNFWISSTRTHMDVDYDTTSDRRKKNSIEHDVAERYGTLYRALRPCRFKYNNGTSDRFHTGFIAQEVEQAITDSGLDTKDLAALVQGEDGMYAIRYAELIALNTAMIQRLMERMDALEATKTEGGNE